MGTPEVGLQLVSLLIDDYHKAIDFYVGKLGFDLVEDSPATSTVTGKPKRWVVVRPPGNPQGCGILLARADGSDQEAILHRQWGGRVGLFWKVADFDVTYSKLRAAGVEFAGSPKLEKYGRVVVFVDYMGNKWDFLGPPSSDTITGGTAYSQHYQTGTFENARITPYGELRVDMSLSSWGGRSWKHEYHETVYVDAKGGHYKDIKEDCILLATRDVPGGSSLTTECGMVNAVLA